MKKEEKVVQTEHLYLQTLYKNENTKEWKSYIIRL